MTEYIVEVDDKVAEVFVERFDWETVTLFGHHLVGEIVRCRDCARYIPQGTYRFNSGVVNKDTCEVIRGFVVQIDPDGFCAWGERREK